MTKKKQQGLDFEKALNELEQLVTTMEAGELSLEQSLQSFERGVGLIKDCQQTLAEAEQKVKILTEQRGELTLTDFNEEKD